MALDDAVEQTEEEQSQKKSRGRKPKSVPPKFDGIYSFDWGEKKGKPVTYEANPSEFNKYLALVASANRSRVLSAPSGLYYRHHFVQKKRSKSKIRKGLITRDELTALSDVKVTGQSKISDLVKKINTILSAKARDAVTLAEKETRKNKQLLFINVPDTYDLQMMSLGERVPYAVVVRKENVSTNEVIETRYHLVNHKELGVWEYVEQK